MLPTKGLQSKARMADPKKSPSGALAFHKKFTAFKNNGVVPDRFRRGSDHIIPNAEDFPQRTSDDVEELPRRPSDGSHHSDASRRPPQRADAGDQDSTSGSWPTWVLIMIVIGILGLVSGVPVSYYVWHHSRSSGSAESAPLTHKATYVHTAAHQGTDLDSSDVKPRSDSRFPRAAEVLRSRKRRPNLTARNLAIAGLGAAVVGGIALGYTGTLGSPAGPDEQSKLPSKPVLAAFAGTVLAAFCLGKATIFGYCSALCSWIFGSDEVANDRGSPPPGPDVAEENLRCRGKGPSIAEKNERHVVEKNAGTSRDPIGVPDRPPSPESARISGSDERAIRVESSPPPPDVSDRSRNCPIDASPVSTRPAKSVERCGSVSATKTSDVKPDVPPAPKTYGSGYKIVFQEQRHCGGWIYVAMVECYKRKTIDPATVKSKTVYKFINKLTTAVQTHRGDMNERMSDFGKGAKIIKWILEVKVEDCFEYAVRFTCPNSHAELKIPRAIKAFKTQRDASEQNAWALQDLYLAPDTGSRRRLTD